MTEQDRQSIAILGSGLFVSLATLAIAQRNPSASISLVDESRLLEGQVINPVFESVIPDRLKPLLDPLIVKRWNGYMTSRVDEVGHHDGQVVLVAPQQILAELHLIDSMITLYECADVSCVTQKIVALGTGQELAADLVLDFRNHSNPNATRGRACYVVESDYLLDSSHGLDKPVMIDTSINQSQSGRLFAQYVPLDERFLRIITIGTEQIAPDQSEDNPHSTNSTVISVSRRSNTFEPSRFYRNAPETPSNSSDLELYCGARLIEEAHLAVELAEDIANGNPLASAVVDERPASVASVF